MRFANLYNILFLHILHTYRNTGKNYFLYFHYHLLSDIIIILYSYSNYRKIELYSLNWGDQIDLSKFFVVAGPYGGPVGMTNYFTHTL